ncbi:hypothetical protein LCGC14_1545100 [marine sediment metagenome]|uniref:Uncharacterized protein n=1 Tax=marine sediment metagenome TaxID=412755 RepID=A0A0F9JCS2_9ZZZZ
MQCFWKCPPNGPPAQWLLGFAAPLEAMRCAGVTARHRSAALWTGHSRISVGDRSLFVHTLNAITLKLSGVVFSRPLERLVRCLS